MDIPAVVTAVATCLLAGGPTVHWLVRSAVREGLDDFLEKKIVGHYVPSGGEIVTVSGAEIERRLNRLEGGLPAR